jgi:UDP-N-acetylmuramate dehydrogenase
VGPTRPASRSSCSRAAATSSWPTTGFDGTVVHVATRGLRLDRGPDGAVLLSAQAGEPWEAVVERAQGEGLAGVECLTGIPGSAGATPIQNVGAYGQEVAATVTEVRALDRRTGAVERLPADACGFRYRTSVFKHDDRRVVLGVSFALRPSERSEPIRYAELARRLGVRVGDDVALADARAAVLDLRRAKGMVVDPADPESVSAGSFFTNPVLDPPAYAALRERVAQRLGDGVSAPAFPEADGRTKTSRPGSSSGPASSAGTRADRWRSRPSTRSPSSTAAARRPRSSSRWRVRSRAGWRRRSASAWCPSRSSWATGGRQWPG